MVKRWVQNINIKKGALHRQLGYSQMHTLPIGLLKDIASAKIGTHVRGYAVTTKLKRRVNFALNIRRPPR